MLTDVKNYLNHCDDLDILSEIFTIIESKIHGINGAKIEKYVRKNLKKRLFPKTQCVSLKILRFIHMMMGI